MYVHKCIVTLLLIVWGLMVLVSRTLAVDQSECECSTGNCNETTSQHCFFTNESCTKCPDDFPIKTDFIKTNVIGCLGSAPNKTCQKCAISCALGECSGNTENCTKCASNKVTEQGIGSSIICESDCYSGHFPDADNMCLPCDSVISKCNDCAPEPSDLSASLWSACNKSCNGGITAPTSNFSLRCDGCEGGYKLYKSDKDEGCTCCAKECPTGTIENSNNICVTEGKKQSYCEKNELLCSKIFPAIGGGVGFLILLVVLVIVTVKCRKRPEKETEPKKSKELPSKMEVDAVTRKERFAYHTDPKAHDDETHSHDSATAIPLLKQSKSSHNKLTLGTGNKGAEVIQKDYENVPKIQISGATGGDQQEIYENTEPVATRASIPPKLPPRRGEEDDEKQDYVNEEAITEFARSNPHLSKKQEVPPPSVMGHTQPKAHGYANQEAIEKYAGKSDGTNEESPEYQNLNYPAISKKPSSSSINKLTPPKLKPSGGSNRSLQSNGLSDEVLAQAVPAPSSHKSSRDYYNVPTGAYYNNK